MRKKLWNAAGLAAMGLIVFVATMIIIRWVVDFVTWTTLDSGWAQAFGSVFAIFATFYLFQLQRKHELQQGRDDDLRRRFLAVQTVSDVTFKALNAIEQLVEIYGSDLDPGIVPDLTPRLPELRAILDRFAESTADRIVVVVALTFSNALAETQDDISIRNDMLESYVFERLRDRTRELWGMQDRLINHMRRLEEQCHQRGIGDDYPESVVAGE